MNCFSLNQEADGDVVQQVLQANAAQKPSSMRPHGCCCAAGRTIIDRVATRGFSLPVENVACGTSRGQEQSSIEWATAQCCSVGL